ncbi:zinc finger protein CONSTANS-LIKE 13-like isoform X1 [Telopea speciosissima]|uniref:zinc finger protein CONSTANS-LIKE 13-like isoform X1 n=1 Tax=Telopea speciosissima TaxID=54955 RepID=UPI001CC75429|nr:zinc finger protein CONSTANS-LIKE 13-like isoform X1 [Telopea speciosissima]
MKVVTFSPDFLCLGKGKKSISEMEKSKMVDSGKPPRRGEEEEEQGGEAEGVPEVAAEEDETKLEQNDRTHQQRLCDFCSESMAILYCRADTAKLCFSCDREVHSGNPLFRKHNRSLLCDACDSSPASIFCSTESLVLCQNCDWNTHGLLSSLHDRRPLEEFSGCPSVIDFSSIFGFDNVGHKSLLPMVDQGDGGLLGSGFYGSVGGIVDELSDAFVWETPRVFSLDDLILSTDSSHNFQAIGNPPLPKNRNATCGQHKEDIQSQLCQLAKLEHCLNIDHGRFESLISVKTQVVEPITQHGNMGNMDARFEHDTEQIVSPGHKGGALQWHSNSCTTAGPEPIPFISLESHSGEGLLFHGKPTEVGDFGSHINCGFKEQTPHPVKEILQGPPKFAPRELTSQERDSVILRYKEKRKARRFDKHIRYESRKARAESRTRIRGRFAKVDQ